MEFISQIYYPSKKDSPIIREEKIFWLGGGIAVLGILISILSDKFGGIYWIEILGTVMGIIGLILFLYGSFACMSKNEPLNGELTEQIKISPTKIYIGQNEYPIFDITNLKIYANDFKGKMYPHYNYIGPWCSNGVKSNISFEFNGNLIKEHFFVADKSKMTELNKIQSEIKNTVANTVSYEKH